MCCGFHHPSHSMMRGVIKIIWGRRGMCIFNVDLLIWTYYYSLYVNVLYELVCKDCLTNKLLLFSSPKYHKLINQVFYLFAVRITLKSVHHCPNIFPVESPWTFSWITGAMMIPGGGTVQDRLFSKSCRVIFYEVL